MIAPIATFMRPLSSLSLALSSLDPVRAALEATVSHFSNRVTLATIAVALGVAFEGVEFIHDAVAWIARRHFRKAEVDRLREIAEFFPIAITVDPELIRFRHPRWLRRFDRWAKRFGKIGLILVVIGVVGEWRYGTKLEDAQNAVHKYDVEKLTAAAQAAGNAEEAAKDAVLAASSAKKLSEEAKKTAGEALSDASSVRGIADAAKVTAGNAQKTVDSVATRAEEIRQDVEAIAPRTLTLGQQRQIRDACVTFFHHNVMVFSYALDGEAAALGGQIIGALSNPGIEIADARESSMPTGGFDFGIHIRGPSTEEVFMECLRDAFVTIGHLEVFPINDPAPRSGGAIFGGGQQFPAGSIFVTVTVGIKPVPILGNEANTSSRKANH